MDRYDVIVVGGGHAGAEAANGSARAGARTLLVTQSLETIGVMSCNPSIGGIAKGTVVREVDALGGVMGRAADRSTIHFRMLNRSKGPAVWSPRAQCDRARYRLAARRLLEEQPKLSFAQGTVTSLDVRGGRVTGLATREGQRFEGRAVVLTAGTFLRGQIHLGREVRQPAGRAGDPASLELSQVLEQQGITLERFKTGTPPRIDGRSVDLSRFQDQRGEEPGFRFSFYEQAARLPQVSCYLGWAGPAVRAVVERHLGESALYGGAISGRGPRYCPSIEDKVVKFPLAERHQLFLEPEGLDTTELYVNGLSTSLPAAVQLEMLRAVEGLESVRMTRPGYAIEYDYIPPTQLGATLESRVIGGLFLAGQVNGTTGYEEAAGQGVIAGINAARQALGVEPFVLRRDEAMIGVLVDDLVTRGVDEPYRLFTSRSEYRLLLRQDNALRRLYPRGVEAGVLTEGERRAGEVRLMEEEEVRSLAERTGATHSVLRALGVEIGGSGAPVALGLRVSELVRRPGVELAAVLRAMGWEGNLDRAEWANIEFKYEGYILRERDAAKRLQEEEEFRLPDGLPFRSFGSLSTEAREKLALIRPETLGQAGRVPGVTPNDLQNLLLEVAKWRRNLEAVAAGSGNEADVQVEE